MERLILGFSGFFALFLGMFFEGRDAGAVSQVTQTNKAQVEYD